MFVYHVQCRVGSSIIDLGLYKDNPTSSKEFVAVDEFKSAVSRAVQREFYAANISLAGREEYNAKSLEEAMLKENVYSLAHPDTNGIAYFWTFNGAVPELETNVEITFKEIEVK
jgi:histidinol phosphatase-like PHP family hydrolase